MMMPPERRIVSTRHWTHEGRPFPRTRHGRRELYTLLRTYWRYWQIPERYDRYVSRFRLQLPDDRSIGIDPVALAGGQSDEQLSNDAQPIA